MQDLRAIFLFFFPMVRKLQRTPMSNVAIFAFAKDSIEHSRGAEQADVSAMQWREGPATDISLFW
jgi:hypothetical protein